MKKTLVALAVAAVAATATTAQAATVYEKDGAKVDLSGSVRVGFGKFEKNERADLRNEGSRFRIDASQDLGNGLNGFAAYELRFESTDPSSSSTFGEPNSKRLYAGFGHEDIGQLSFGRQVTTADDVELGDYSYVNGGNNNLVTSHTKSIKFVSSEFEGVKIGLDYLFGKAEKKDDKGKAVAGLKRGYGASLFYSAEVAQDINLNLTAGYTNAISNVAMGQDIKKGTVSAWRTAAELDFGQFAFAVNYGEKNLSKNTLASMKEGEDWENDVAVGAKSKAKYVLVGAKYQVMEPSTVYVQWNQDVAKARGNDGMLKQTQRVALVGADYKLHKNVVTYVEYARLETKYKKGMKAAVKDNTNAYTVGFRAYF